ncbi:MAG TPA: MBL fold metallo-hydrolase [Spirochaetota bacterium]|nr:MBL fold metallo-hydrolase [Spirochaetota bacterium]
MAYEIPEMYRIKDFEAEVKGNILSLEWTGTAGFRIRYQNTTLLIDAFATRTGMLIAPFIKLKINRALCEEVFPEADHILVGHSHYDHLQDIPTVAKKTGAIVHGSNSTARILRGNGVEEEKIHVVETWKTYDCGSFKITFVPSLHGKALLGRVPCPGEIEKEFQEPLRMSWYRHSQVFGIIIDAGGFKIYHSGSADLMDEEIAKVGHVDLLMMCLAGRKGTPDYVERVAGKLQPEYILPHHYDNFFKPLMRPMKLLPSINMPQFFEEVRAFNQEIPVIMPEIFQKIFFDTVNGQILNNK